MKLVRGIVLCFCSVLGFRGNKDLSLTRFMRQDSSSSASRRTQCRFSWNDIDWQRIEIDAAAAFIGGTFGVMGTLVVYEQGRYKARMRVACPYCEGRGALTCGACAGTNPDCTVCGGTGRIKCVNCEATGLAIPPQLERKPDAQMDDELETKLDQIGIAALAADILKQEASPDDMTEYKLLLQRRAEVVSRKARSSNGHESTNKAVADER
mmetsp:Transcript_6351/g.8941  ORF Transcript_6351/g.8941 Transcript_6351/m.8941 type:complete len:210 (+) Transcript_6351:38-667(+)